MDRQATSQTERQLSRSFARTLLVWELPFIPRYSLPVLPPMDLLTAGQYVYIGDPEPIQSKLMLIMRPK